LKKQKCGENEYEHAKGGTCMNKKLPVFHPGIPAVISCVFAIITALVSAKWLDFLMKL